MFVKLKSVSMEVEGPLKIIKINVLSAISKRLTGHLIIWFLQGNIWFKGFESFVFREIVLKRMRESIGVTGNRFDPKLSCERNLRVKVGICH